MAEDKFKGGFSGKIPAKETGEDAPGSRFVIRQPDCFRRTGVPAFRPGKHHC